MDITIETTVKSILDAFPDAPKIFEKHGVYIEQECDESILDTELAVCDSMCHIDDLDSLINDLREYVAAQ